MATSNHNPFLVSGYETPDFFCDREKETASLLEAFRNGRNVTLTSPRRMGKTGLIKHVLHMLRKQASGTATVYIDLFPTENLAEFTQAFSSAVLEQLDSNPAKLFRKAADLFKGLRPNFSVDEATGSLKVGLDIVKGEETHTLEQVFTCLRDSGKDCYIAMDEFQQVSAYPESQTEALLRTYVQDAHNVHFIFSGSQEHMLREMFHSPKRPFWQSTSGMDLHAIEEGTYHTFAAAFFKAQGRTLPEEVFHEVYQRYEGYTWYIQMVLNRMYSKEGQSLDVRLVQLCIREILEENAYYYQHLTKVYSPGQVRLLKALAKEGKVKEITSGSFVARHGLAATSSVKSALTRLLEEEVVYPSTEGYLVYDRFFGDWLDWMF